MLCCLLHLRMKPAPRQQPELVAVASILGVANFYVKSQKLNLHLLTIFSYIYGKHSYNASTTLSLHSPRSGCWHISESEATRITRPLHNYQNAFKLWCDTTPHVAKSWDSGFRPVSEYGAGFSPE